jgi:hypothetical protein
MPRSQAISGGQSSSCGCPQTQAAGDFSGALMKALGLQGCQGQANQAGGEGQGGAQGAQGAQGSQGTQNAGSQSQDDLLEKLAQALGISKEELLALLNQIKQQSGNSGCGSQGASTQTADATQSAKAA